MSNAETLRGATLLGLLAGLPIALVYFGLVTTPKWQIARAISAAVFLAPCGAAAGAVTHLVRRRIAWQHVPWMLPLLCGTTAAILAMYVIIFITDQVSHLDFSATPSRGDLFLATTTGMYSAYMTVRREAANHGPN